MQAATTKFTTSGLQILAGSIQHQPPKVSRKSLPKIGEFEKDCLFSNPIYVGMSSEHQASIQQDAQIAFFAWIMSNRVDRKSTTSLTKRKMYEEIVQKLLASVEVEGGLFPFLGMYQAPAFGGGSGFDLPVLDCEEPWLCASPFDGLPVTRVIPSSQVVSEPIPPAYCVPYSESPSHLDMSEMSADCNHSNIEEEMLPDGCMTFSLPLSPTQDSLSFLHELTSYSLSVLQTEAVVNRIHEDAAEQPNPVSVFEMLPFPGVAETLAEISEIHAQISEVWNHQTIDIMLGPTDWLQSTYPCGVLPLICNPEQ